MKLFAIYIGGEAPGANIEVHDMRFVTAESIVDTHDELRRQWWGTPGSLHIDCWAEIDHADGYDISVRDEPYDGAEKLFYVNLGGYDRIDFAEKHKNVFVVAKNVAEAKARALASAENWRDLHRDDLYEAEQVISLNNNTLRSQPHIHLQRSTEAKQFDFKCKYTSI